MVWDDPFLGGTHDSRIILSNPGEPHNHPDEGRRWWTEGVSWMRFVVSTTLDDHLPLRASAEDTMLASLRRPAALVAVLLGCLLLVGVARASWRQLDQLYVDDQLVCRDGMRFGAAYVEGGAPPTTPITTTFGVRLADAATTTLVMTRTITLPYTTTTTTVTPTSGFGAKTNHLLISGLAPFSKVVAVDSTITATFDTAASGIVSSRAFPVRDCYVYGDLGLSLAGPSAPVSTGSNLAYDLSVHNNSAAQIISHAGLASAQAISIPAVGAATPYPASYNVHSMTGRITDLQVKLFGVTEANAADLDVLLVAPDGTNVMLMSDVGEGQALN